MTALRSRARARTSSLSWGIDSGVRNVVGNSEGLHEERKIEGGGGVRQCSKRYPVYAGVRIGPDVGERDPAAGLELGPVADADHDRAHLLRRHVVEQQPRRPGRERLVDFLRGTAL